MRIQDCFGLRLSKKKRVRVPALDAIKSKADNLSALAPELHFRYLASPPNRFCGNAIALPLLQRPGLNNQSLRVQRKVIGLIDDANVEARTLQLNGSRHPCRAGAYYEDERVLHLESRLLAFSAMRAHWDKMPASVVPRVPAMPVQVLPSTNRI